MKWQLVVDRGRHKGQIIPITRATFLIGRDSACHLRPTAANVSRQHCVLSIEQGRLFVFDCQTTNGTFVNAHRLKQEQELQPGDHLQVGPLAFEIGLAEQPATIEPDGEEQIEDTFARIMLAMDAEGDLQPSQSETKLPTTEGRAHSAETQSQHAESPPVTQSNQVRSEESGDSANSARLILQQYLRRPSAVRGARTK